MKPDQTSPLYNHRLRLVRLFLENPRQWPDGIDWPHWQQPHDLWYSDHKEDWDRLAKSKLPPESPPPDSPPKIESIHLANSSPDSLLTTQVLDLAKGGASLRDIAKSTSLSIGKVQRILATSKSTN